MGKKDETKRLNKINWKSNEEEKKEVELQEKKKNEKNDEDEKVLTKG